MAAVPGWSARLQARTARGLDGLRFCAPEGARSNLSKDVL
jgi:hypothetical protein